MTSVKVQRIGNRLCRSSGVTRQHMDLANTVVTEALDRCCRINLERIFQQNRTAVTAVKGGMHDASGTEFPRGDGNAVFFHQPRIAAQDSLPVHRRTDTATCIFRYVRYF